MARVVQPCSRVRLSGWMRPESAAYGWSRLIRGPGQAAGLLPLKGLSQRSRFRETTPVIRSVYASKLGRRSIVCMVQEAHAGGSRVWPHTVSMSGILAGTARLCPVASRTTNLTAGRGRTAIAQVDDIPNRILVEAPASMTCGRPVDGPPGGLTTNPDPGPLTSIPVTVTGLLPSLDTTTLRTATAAGPPLEATRSPVCAPSEKRRSTVGLDVVTADPRSRCASQRCTAAPPNTTPMAAATRTATRAPRPVAQHIPRSPLSGRPAASTSRRRPGIAAIRPR
jgi:hypothetical protein